MVTYSQALRGVGSALEAYFRCSILHFEAENTKYIQAHLATHLYKDRVLRNPHIFISLSYRYKAHLGRRRSLGLIEFPAHYSGQGVIPLQTGC